MQHVTLGGLTAKMVAQISPAVMNNKELPLIAMMATLRLHYFKEKDGED